MVDLPGSLLQVLLLLEDESLLRVVLSLRAEGGVLAELWVGRMRRADRLFLGN